jgi:dolichol kinase
MRQHEANQVTGAIWYNVGALLTVAALPREVALLSLLYLAFGDPVAAFFGTWLGDQGPRFPNGKSWIGTGTSAFVCSAIGFIFIQNLASTYGGASTGSVLVLSIVGGVTAAVVEALPLPLNDNLSIPLISGLVLWFGFIFLGMPGL